MNAPSRPRRRPSEAGTSSLVPPAWFWILPGLIGLLRLLPFLWSYLLEPADGMTVTHVGYNPPDFLSYLAFIRQLSEDGRWIWYDPFTTQSHEPRFVLLFFWLVGALARVAAVAPTVVLELSRVPLTFLFFWVLWWFLHPIAPKRADRLAVCVLVGLSGGLEGFVRLFLADLPATVNPGLIAQSTWPLFGWNTFQSLHNPLWIAALTLTLVVLRPVVDPEGPSGARDHLLIGLGFFALYWVHPYSAIVVLAVLLVRPLLDWIFRHQADWGKYTRVAADLALPLVLIAVVVRWQTRDAVFAAASGNVFGSLDLPVFWYPLTLGAVGVIALRGAQQWARERPRVGIALASWVIAIILLHTSPLLNGFHFVFHLHLALCVLAAPAAKAVFDGLRAQGAGHRLSATAMLVALFSGFLLVTIESVNDIEDQNVVAESYSAVVATLAGRPQGNALAPPRLGNMVPAYTHHRVFVGHWFLTPGFPQKAAAYDRLTSDPARHDELRTLIDSERIDYLVVPRDRSLPLVTALGDRIAEQIPQGDQVLFVLR